MQKCPGPGPGPGVASCIHYVLGFLSENKKAELAPTQTEFYLEYLSDLTEY